MRWIFTDFFKLIAGAYRIADAKLIPGAENITYAFWNFILLFDLCTFVQAWQGDGDSMHLLKRPVLNGKGELIGVTAIQCIF